MLAPAAYHRKCLRRSLGCWMDEPARAIAGGIRLHSDNLDDCQKYATDHGYSVFAVQYNTECFTAEDAQETYKIYGVSSVCDPNGRGGSWSQNVYEVVCEPRK